MLPRDPLLSDVTALVVGTRTSTAFCGRILADLGARVTRLEPPAARGGPDVDPAYRTYLTDGTLLRRADGPGGLAGALAAEPADVVVCDDPAVADAARAADSEAVVVLVTDYGRSGPSAATPASELTLQAEAGLVAVHPTGERPPVRIGIPLSELSAGIAAATGSVQALLSRRAGARGPDVDVSRFESLVGLIQYPWMTEQIEGHVPYVVPASPVPGLEEAADGWVCMVALTPSQWSAFTAMTGVPELADERFGNVSVRFQHAAELTELVRRFTTKHTVAELVELGVRHRVPITPVATASNAVDLPPFRARGSYLRHPSGGFAHPRPPFRITGHAGSTGLAPVLVDPARPLRGMRVTEIGVFQTGPLVTAHLALLGADVVKVEAVQRPDMIRFAGGPPKAARTWERAAAFLAVNVGKRAVTAELGDPRGLGIVRRLIAASDVVVDNYVPRTLSGRGLDFAGMRALAPDAVVLRMPAWGLDGPWADRAGYTYSANAMSGVADLTGYADGGPTLSGTIFDPLAAQYGVLVTLAALHRRRVAGGGADIELALCDVAAQFSAEAVVRSSAGRPGPARTGNADPAHLHDGTHRCADDGWIAVSVPDAAAAAALARAVSPAGPAPDAAALVERWCATRTAAEAVEGLRAAGVPAAVVGTGTASARHPQLVARERVFDSVHPVAGRVSYIGPPWRVTPGTAPSAPRPAPLFDQDTDDVLAELGYSDVEVAALRADAVIGAAPLGLPLPPLAPSGEAAS